MMSPSGGFALGLKFGFCETQSVLPWHIHPPWCCSIVFSDLPSPGRRLTRPTFAATNLWICRTFLAYLLFFYCVPSLCLAKISTGYSAPHLQAP
jgi:hypothetical protein